MSEDLGSILAGQGDGGNAGGADAGGGGEGGGGGAAAAATGGGDGEPWYSSLSDEAADGALSDRKWAENKKYADVPTLVKSARELEKQFLGGDKIVLPKDGASEAELDAFYAKIGRPDAPDKYEIKAPEGKELDEQLVDRIRNAAFKAGTPAKMLAPLVDEFNAHIMDLTEQQEAMKSDAAKEGVAIMRKEWGASAPQQLAAANRAMTMLELTGDDVNAIGDALPEKDGKNGTARALALLARLGTGMGEDVLSGGGGPRKFGMSGAEAQAKLDAMAADPATVAKLEAKDPALTAQRRQLLEIVAAYEDAADAKR